MPTSSPLPPSQRNLPIGPELFLDHIGHFVADPEAASRALQRAGFAPTPISVQINPDPAGGPPKLTGTGNTCVMLERGYLEFLYKTADTPLGREFDTSAARYSGVHLAAFAIDDPPLQHARIANAGFKVQPLVTMERPVETEAGPDKAGFWIVRVEAGQMPEGRIQMLRHMTEHTVWQPRWLSHPNTAVALTSLTIVEQDVAEAADRFARLLGHPAARTDAGMVISLDRGVVELVSADAWRARWPELAAPDLPYMGAYGLAVRSLAKAAEVMRAGGLRVEERDGRLAVRFPAEAGDGIWLLEQA